MSGTPQNAVRGAGAPSPAQAAHAEGDVKRAEAHARYQRALGFENAVKQLAEHVAETVDHLAEDDERVARMEAIHAELTADWISARVATAFEGRAFLDVVDPAVIDEEESSLIERVQNIIKP